MEKIRIDFNDLLWGIFCDCLIEMKEEYVHFKSTMEAEIAGSLALSLGPKLMRDRLKSPPPSYRKISKAELKLLAQLVAGSQQLENEMKKFAIRQFAHHVV